MGRARAEIGGGRLILPGSYPLRLFFQNGKRGKVRWDIGMLNKWFTIGNQMQHDVGDNRLVFHFE